MKFYRSYFWEDHIARIADSKVFSAHRLVNTFLRRESIDLCPVYIHEFRDAMILDGSAYLASRHRMELRSALEARSLLRQLSVIPAAPRAEISEASLVSGVAGSTWFGHWLEDEVPMHMLATAYAPPVAHVRPSYEHEQPYLDLLGLEAPMRVGTAHISRLTIVDEFAQNPHKARRYWRVRERIAQGRTRNGRRVFLNRGRSGALRAISNEAPLLDRFRKEGYTVLDLTGASLEQILNVLAGANLVVSVEGSHLAHALYAMARFGTMVIVNPPWQVHTTVADIAPFCELHPAMYICTSQGDGAFHAHPDELLKFIDDAVADSAARREQLELFLETLRMSSTLDRAA
jgi:capsular polysaccharide biosynthesis protein